jgi:uncharacterized protein
MIVTQRTQALHNALLGSCDTMIAHRLTAPADQEPVKKWLKANVSKEIFDRVSASLAGLKTGSAWICSGEAQVAELAQFPKITTFDNSATPDGNEASQEIKTAPVDQDKLRAIIGAAVKEVEADDPKALRAEITRLTAELAKRPTAPTVDPGAIAAADRTGFERGYRKGIDDADHRARCIIRDQLANVSNLIRSELTGLNLPDVAPSAPRSAAAMPAQPTRAPRPSAPNGSLPGPEQRIINALATWAAWGQHQPSNSQVAWLAGYSPSSSSYANLRGALKSKGLLEYPAPDMLALTDAGAAAGAPIALNGSLLDLVLSKLSGPEARILRGVAARYPLDA